MNLHVIIQVSKFLCFHGMCIWSQITINVQDVNDNVPVCVRRSHKIYVYGDPSYVLARLGSSRTEPLATVRANDADMLDADGLEYTIISGNELQTFRVNTNTGDVRFLNPLSNELNNFPLTIQATDRADQSATCLLSILIFRNGSLMSIPINGATPQTFNVTAFENTITAILSAFYDRPFVAHVYRTDPVPSPGGDEPPL